MCFKHGLAWLQPHEPCHVSERNVGQKLGNVPECLVSRADEGMSSTQSVVLRTIMYADDS